MRRSARYFRFSLRTLFLLITCACVWLGYQMNIVRARHALRKAVAANGGSIVDEDPSAARMPDIEDIPWYRKLLGDRAAASIGVGTDHLSGQSDRATVERVLQVFPEAEVWYRDEFGFPYVRIRDLTGKLRIVNPLPGESRPT